MHLESTGKDKSLFKVDVFEFWSFMSFTETNFRKTLKIQYTSNVDMTNVNVETKTTDRENTAKNWAAPLFSGYSMVSHNQLLKLQMIE